MAVSWQGRVLLLSGGGCRQTGGSGEAEPQLPAAASKETSVGTVVHSMAKWEREARAVHCHF